MIEVNDMGSYNDLNLVMGKFVSEFRSHKPYFAKEIAKIVADYTTNAFEKRAWDGKVWPDLSAQYKTMKIKAGKSNLADLVFDGDLYSDVQAALTAGVNRASFDLIYFSIKNPYASIHNNGENGMPKRQFIGESAELDEILSSKLDREIENIFNNI